MLFAWLSGKLRSSGCWNERGAHTARNEKRRTIAVAPAVAEVFQGCPLPPLFSPMAYLRLGVPVSAALFGMNETARRHCFSLNKLILEIYVG